MTKLVLTCLLVVTVLEVQAGSRPFYGPCKPVKSIAIDESKWSNPSTRYVSFHMSAKGFSCESVINSLIIRDGETLLGNTWTRDHDGETVVTSIEAEHRGDNRYVYYREINGHIVKFNAHFLYDDPGYLTIVYACTHDRNFEEGGDQVFVQTDTMELPINDTRICMIQDVLQANGLKFEELGVIRNCGCSNGIRSNREDCHVPAITDYQCPQGGY